jgi:small subunit ribosomal protein S3Ae
MAQDIEKQCQPIFPLQNAYIRKVKVLKKPRFDLTKLMEMHTGMNEDTGAKLDKEDADKKEKLAGAGGRL